MLYCYRPSMTPSLAPFLTPQASSTTPCLSARKARWLQINSVLLVPREHTLMSPKLLKCAPSATLASTIQILPREPVPSAPPSRMLKVSQKPLEQHLLTTARGNVLLDNTTMLPPVFAETVDMESTNLRRANSPVRFVELG